MATESTPLTTKRSRRKNAASDEGDFFSPESREMDKRRRRLEKEGHRRWGRMSIYDDETAYISDDSEDLDLGAEEGYSPTHPYLDSQLFDGMDDVDPDLNPHLDGAKLRELKNKKRQQEYEKQLRLQNRLGLSMSNKYTPKLRR